MSETHDTRLLSGGAATPLSVLGQSRDVQRMLYAARCRCTRTLEHVARFSLILLTMTCATGCFDPAPQYSEPTLVPPVIVADLCDPPTTQLFRPPPQGEAQFTVVFRADDGDRSLKARLGLDITLSSRPQGVDEKSIAPDPRPFADQEDPSRAVSLSWPWDKNDYGCHVVTAIITDGNNFNGLVGTLDPFAAAKISWFVWLQDPDKPAELVTCFDPNAAGVAQ